MGWFAKLMLVVGIALGIVLFKFHFSETLEAVLISLFVGIVVFILFSLISGIRNYSSMLKGKKEDKFSAEKIIKRGIRNRIIGVVLLIITIIVFLNSYLYVKALLGNDMLISLKIDKENLVLKNGEEGQLNVDAKVLTNPFCKADCILSLEDLSKGEIIYSDMIYLKVSSPLSKDYLITSQNNKFGQALYKVSLECNTMKSRFCYTSSNISKLRTRIISVDYKLDDIQEARKEELKNETEILSNEFYTMQNSLNKFYFNFSSLDLSEFEKESKDLYNLSNPIANEINNLSLLYENQEYYELGTKIYNITEEIRNIRDRFNELNSSVLYNINTYNSLIDNMSSMYNDILYLEDYNFSDSSLPYAKSFVEDFNSAILKFNKYDKIQDKIILFNNLESEKENLFFILKNESPNNASMGNNLDVSINPVNLKKILIKNEIYNSNFELKEPSPICCLKNNCYKCINDSSLNYPIIFVHGHSFNEKLSAELSMESFGEMAREMDKEGYIDAGYFYGSQYNEISKGYLGKVNNSIVVEATYYLDTLVTEEGSFILNSKWENIDTYAERLNEVISNVKYLTGKDKVIIVAHSMGGLVTRKYIQLHGDESLDRLILVGIPNHGVDGFVLNYCSVFGADIECSEMNKSSLFLSELNSVPIPNIPVYNIIGTGCFWENSEGDGIVKAQSAYLENSENIYVEGTCNGVDFFHVKMIKPSKYPEIYKLIRDLIRK